VKHLKWGALNLQDRKMKDKEISGGGKCRTGKGWTKVQGWKMQDWKLTDKSATSEKCGTRSANV